MPNIEIYGLAPGDPKIGEVIDVLCRGLDVETSKDVVVTRIDSEVEDLKFRPQPFLRIIDSNSVRAVKIAELFTDWDVEVPPPITFFPRKTSETNS
jgi:hypothetical protein